MDKKKIILWGIMLLIGFMLTGCAGYYGGYGYYDSPYYGYDYGYYGFPYNHYSHERGEHGKHH